MKTAATLITAALVMAIPSLAHAERETVTFKYSDLNLSTPVGQKALESRVKHAARKVCGDYVGVKSLDETKQIEKCVFQATQQAMVAVNPDTGAQLVSR
jgi:UrcA family protein